MQGSLSQARESNSSFEPVVFPGVNGDALNVDSYEDLQNEVNPRIIPEEVFEGAYEQYGSSEVYKIIQINSLDDVKNQVSGSGAKGRVVVKGGKAMMNNFAIFSLAKDKNAYHSINDFFLNPNNTSEEAGNDIQKPEYVEPTLKNILNYFSSDNLGDKVGPIFAYQPKDFVYARYFGEIPNNRLITLRRFLYPTTDALGPVTVTNKNAEIQGVKYMPPVAKAVTYFGEETENKLSEIMQFSTKYNWEDIESDVWEEDGKIPGFSDLPGSVSNSGALRTVTAFYSGQASGSGDLAQRSKKAQQIYGKDAYEKTHPNAVYGPVNVIKNTKKRQKGLEFEQQNLKINFQFDLTAGGNISPKVGMLDVLANMLALCYDYAPWWGGDVRFFPDVPQVPFLGDWSSFYAGDYQEYFRTLSSDVSNIADSIQTDLQAMFDPSSDPKETMNKIKSMIGGGLKMFLDMESAKSRPDAIILPSLISGNPVGNWHLVVGNPMNPIMMIGNLICEQAIFQFSDDLGAEDFPTSMSVQVELAHGRPRDGAEIQSMFNRGTGKLYRTLPSEKFAGEQANPSRGEFEDRGDGIEKRDYSQTPSNYIESIHNGIIEGAETSEQYKRTHRGEIEKIGNYVRENGGLFGKMGN
jgi:hypothetical protein